MKKESSVFKEATDYHRRGDLVTAVRLYQDVLKQNPEHADAIHMLGVIAMQRGDSLLASKLINLSLSQDNSNPLAWSNLAQALMNSNQPIEAENAARQAINLSPQSPEAWNILGNILKNREELTEAEQCYRNAVKLAPNAGSYSCNLAKILLEQQRIIEAYKLLLPFTNKADGLINLTIGDILKAAGQPRSALSYFRKASAQLPSSLHASTNEAVALLQCGDWQNGFRLYEGRPDTAPAHIRVHPFWDGISDVPVIFYEDQGLGDAIQFIRYLPTLRKTLSKFFVLIPAPLKKLMQHNFPLLHFVDADKLPPEATHRFRLTSLPHVIGCDALSVAQPSQICSDPAIESYWHNRLHDKPNPRIGIVWAGNPKNKTDRRRSMPFQDVTPLLETCGCTFISLQVGDAAKQHHKNLLDASSELKDFSDTAGLITQLDLVITVDTAVAHCAASLGVPVWLCISMNPDWRWLLNRTDTAWYPTVKLYRQKSYGGWADVISRVKNDLASYVAGNTDILRPTPSNNARPDIDDNAIILD